MVTMKIENKIIDTMCYKEFNEIDSLVISNSIIKKIDFISFESDFSIVIENSIIYDLLIHSCWFKAGLIFKNNQVMNYVNYQMGGHNEAEIKIVGNIFSEFVNFFDCQFEKDIEVKNNVFSKGCNLLGNLDEGFKNSFETPAIIEDNIGAIDLNGEGY